MAILRSDVVQARERRKPSYERSPLVTPPNGPTVEAAGCRGRLFGPLHPITTAFQCAQSIGMGDAGHRRGQRNQTYFRVLHCALLDHWPLNIISELDENQR